jgi:hypothetical protein
LARPQPLPELHAARPSLCGMELLSSSEDGSFNERGTAADHFKLGCAHIGHSFKLFISCGRAGQRKPPPAPAKVARASSSEDDEDEREDAKVVCTGEHGVILPTEGWKEMWDVWVLALILYSAVMVPYHICFEAPALGFLMHFEQVVTLSFIVDVCFNFNTAYMEEEQWVTDRGSIAKHYLSVRAVTCAAESTREPSRAAPPPRAPPLAPRGARASPAPVLTLRAHARARLPWAMHVHARRSVPFHTWLMWLSLFGRLSQGWFWIDAPSSIPTELFVTASGTPDSHVAYLRFLRLFRLLRLLRLLKIGASPRITTTKCSPSQCMQCMHAVCPDPHGDQCSVYAH